jgi:hypothetical protein
VLTLEVTCSVPLLDPEENQISNLDIMLGFKKGYALLSSEPQ